MGAFLNVHEGPHGLANVPRGDYAGGLVEHMTVTDEPGYYEDGAFGIRIENVLVVRKAAPPCAFGGDVWLEFEPITRVPISTRCVDASMLSDGERRWLNAYNEGVRAELTPLLGGDGDADARAWLHRETAPV